MDNARFGAVLLALLAPLAVLAQEPAGDPEAAVAEGGSGGLVGVPVTWAEETPLPGELVKFRLRGAALSRLLSYPEQYELTAGAETVPAIVVLPEARPAPPRFSLQVLSESGPDQPDLVLDLDRGAAPQPINRLELSLASSRLLAKASIAAGASLDALKPAGEPQLVYHELKNGRVLKLATLTLDPGEARYLRLRLTGAGGTKTQQVEAWFEPEEQRPVYEVPAALGSMQEGLMKGEHKWPVILQDSRLPLAKLKVLADAPGKTRLISVIRENIQSGSSDLLELTWADTLKLGKLTLSDKWIELPGVSQQSNLVLAVYDGDGQPLQLKGVQAMAAEVWLVTTRPETDDLVLWLDRSAAAEDTASLDLSRAHYGGEFSEPALARPVDEGWGGGAKGWWGGPAWLRVVLYGAAALVLLLIGITLLRRPVRAA